MPQLDIDLFDDFLFFAFVSLLFVVEMGTDIFLAQYYISTKKKLEEQRRIVKDLFVTSILRQK
jgi:membrane-anchored protein YejM (alkaline phosphatase superfamily)